jgi:hypothetical protein
MNVQILTDPTGRLLRVSPAIPEAVHDVRATREHGSSPLSRRPSSPAGQTRVAETREVRSASRTGAGGRGSPQVRTPSIGPTRRSTED